MEANQKNVETIIKKGIMSSMAAGALPVPLIDVALVIGAQLNMIQQLCEAYQVEYSKEKINAWILSVMSGSLLLRFGGTALKGIPGIGWLVGGATLAITSGASTYAIGQIALNYLENEKPFDETEIENTRYVYEKEFSRGKDFVKNMSDPELEIVENGKVEAAKSEAEILLQKLQNLKEAGILTEKEFEIKRKRCLKFIRPRSR